MSERERKIRIPPLEDRHLRAGCYQPADKETVAWRTGWRNGFVGKWNTLNCYCADQCFSDKEGWKEGEDAGERDARNKCPTYPHPKRKRTRCPSRFRVAWRLGWYKAYYGAGGGGEETARGCGYRTGITDAVELQRFESLASERDGSLTG